MFRKQEMAKTIKRQGESIIALNNRITQLNQKVENQKAVMSEQIDEEIALYENLRLTKVLYAEAEMRATEFARKLKKIEDVVNEFGLEKNITKQIAINFYTKLKNVLVNSDQTNN